MKTLLDIQKEIRVLEDNVNDISKRLKNINSDISHLKDENNKTNLDYNVIKNLSKYIKFKNHPIDSCEDIYIRKLYIEILINIANLDIDRENEVNRLIFIQWFLDQSKLDISLENAIIESYSVGANELYEFANGLSERIKQYFILDAMIVANIAGKANSEIMEYIANLCLILKMDKDDIKNIAVFSKYVLCKDIEVFIKTDFNVIKILSEKFDSYVLDDINNKVKAFYRKIIAHFPSDRMLKYKKQQGEWVNKGDIIATYETAKKRKNETGEIISPCDGNVFFFKTGGMEYIVLSHFSDNKQSIKYWVTKLVKRGEKI